MSKTIKKYRSMFTASQFDLRRLRDRYRRLADAAYMRGDYDAMHKHSAKAHELNKELYQHN